MPKSSPSKVTVAVIAGTTRVQRQSIQAARLVADIGRTYHELEIVFVDPADIALPGDGNDPEGQNPAYTAITERADAFFIVTPEYNHSFPGSLKRLLDSEQATYLHKPVALAGVSNGGWGGVRAVEALVTTVREMGLVVTLQSVYFPRVQDMFDDEGQLKAASREQTIRNVRAAYDELIWMAQVLKWGRGHVPYPF